MIHTAKIEYQYETETGVVSVSVHVTNPQPEQLRIIIQALDYASRGLKIE